MSPERFLIDTNIFDRIADDLAMLATVGTLVAAKRIRLLSTHIQRDEIDAVPDHDRREQLRSVPAEEVPTFGFVIGVSRLGQARFGVDAPFEQLRAGEDRLTRTHDALIAVTAQFEDATLVTEDFDLAKRATAAGVPVIDWPEFRSRIEALAASGA